MTFWHGRNHGRNKFRWNGMTKRIFLNIVICDLQLEQARNIAFLVWVTSRQSHDIAGFAYPLCNFQLSLSRPLLRLTMENDVAALVRPLF